MEWVASTLHTTSEHGVSSITTADTHTSAGSSRLNLRPLRFKWTRPFRRKKKYGFCACVITFQLAPTARQATDENIKQRMRFTCWIPKATNTYSEYVIFIAFPFERASMLRYAYIVSNVSLVYRPPRDRKLQQERRVTVNTTAVAQWLRCCATIRKVAGSILISCQVGSKRSPISSQL